MTPSEISAFIRDVPDFPKPGVLFKDLTPLFANHRALTAVIDLMCEPWADAGCTMVAGVEARGFLLAPLVAQRLGVGMVPIRKPGKLPWRSRRIEYALEYGTDALEMHEDAVGPDDLVLIIDDVLATGGTATAAVQLVRNAGASVAGAAFAIELGFLNGRDALADVRVSAVVTYP